MTTNHYGTTMPNEYYTIEFQSGEDTPSQILKKLETLKGKLTLRSDQAMIVDKAIKHLSFRIHEEKMATLLKTDLG